MRVTLVCPMCREHDRIQAVNVAVEEGTRVREDNVWEIHHQTDKNGRDDSHWDLVPRTYVERSEVAKRLRMPDKPEAHTNGPAMRCFLVVAFITVAAVCGGVPLWWGLYQLNPPPTSPLAGQAAPSAYIFIAFGVVVIGIFFSLYLRDLNRDRVAAASFKTELPRWEKAKAKWDQAYYCWRDDIVFLPDDPGSYVRSKDMMQLLYR